MNIINPITIIHQFPFIMDKKQSTSTKKDSKTTKTATTTKTTKKATKVVDEDIKHKQIVEEEENNESDNNVEDEDNEDTGDNEEDNEEEDEEIPIPKSKPSKKSTTTPAEAFTKQIDLDAKLFRLEDVRKYINKITCGSVKSSIEDTQKMIKEIIDANGGSLKKELVPLEKRLKTYYNKYNSIMEYASFEKFIDDCLINKQLVFGMEKQTKIKMDKAMAEVFMEQNTTWKFVKNPKKSVIDLNDMSIKSSRKSRVENFSPPFNITAEINGKEEKIYVISCDLNIRNVEPLKKQIITTIERYDEDSSYKIVMLIYCPDELLTSTIKKLNNKSIMTIVI